MLFCCELYNLPLVVSIKVTNFIQYKRMCSAVFQLIICFAHGLDRGCMRSSWLESVWEQPDQNSQTKTTRLSNRQKGGVVLDQLHVVKFGLARTRFGTKLVDLSADIRSCCNCCYYLRSNICAYVIAKLLARHGAAICKHCTQRHT